MRLRDKNGFTLLEMVVAVAIFVVLSLLVTNIFLIATKSHRRTMAVQKILGDARFAMESMAREIRMDAVDYDYVSGQPTGELFLRDADNVLITFAKIDNEICPDEASRPCLAVGQDTDGDNVIDQWASITPAGVKLANLNFYIAPVKDPFNLVNYEYAANEQPRVTIVLTNRSVNPAQSEVAPEVVYLQTTVGSRVYKR